MTTPLEVIQRATSSAATFGERILPNGCRLLGYVPHVAPEAWFHILFPPLDGSRLDALRRDLSRSIPDDYCSFLKEANGVHLFSGSLDLFGSQGPLRREDREWRAPFDLVTPNEFERPVGIADDLVIVGSYGRDGSGVWMSVKSQSIAVIQERSARIVREWPTLVAFLVDECKRLAQYYDHLGRPLAGTGRSAPAPTHQA